MRGSGLSSSSSSTRTATQEVHEVVTPEGVRVKVSSDELGMSLREAEGVVSSSSKKLLIL